MNSPLSLGWPLYPVPPEGLATLAVRESRPPDTPNLRLRSTWLDRRRLT